MRRRMPFLVAAAWLLVALLPVPGVLADGPSPDPRCADWEQHGAPAGIDMRLVCTAGVVVDAYTGRAEAGDDVFGADRLMPYTVAALITGIGLMIVGVVAARVIGRQAGRRMAPDSPVLWWVCPACQSVNAESRAACYACHAERQRADAGEARAREPMTLRRSD